MLKELHIIDTQIVNLILQEGYLANTLINLKE